MDVVRLRTFGDEIHGRVVQPGSGRRCGVLRGERLPEDQRHLSDAQPSPPQLKAS